MSYYRFFNSRNDFSNDVDFTETLKGVFINTSYESNRIKCAEAYVDNFLFNENVDKDTTIVRLKEISSSTMLPIRDIECNKNNLCSIKCEDYDVQIEVENTGPFSFKLDNQVYVLPPIPNKSVDLERLKIEVSPRQTFLKPIIVPKFEIANILEDTIVSLKNHEAVWSSLLFQTYGNIGEEILQLLASGGQFLPSGYVVSKSSHEPPNLRTVTIEPFEKFVMKVTRPLTAAIPDMLSIMESVI